jgi:hypothetical protein
MNASFTSRRGASGATSATSSVSRGSSDRQSSPAKPNTAAEIPSLGVPSASQAPRAGHDAAGYNLCRIEGNPGAWHCEIVVRGLAHDGESVSEIRRFALSWP